MDTKKFWEDRLSKGVGIQQTGHRAFSLEYNQLLYKVQADCLDELIQKNHIIAKNASYLDVGCGGGFFIEYFAQKGASPIFGIDITKQSIEHLQSIYPDYSFFESDISASHLPVNGSFSIITAISVMYHIIDNEKFQIALSNMCSLLQPGGYLILYDTFAKHLSPSPNHVRLRDFSKYKSILESQKVQVLEIKPAYYFLNRSFIPFLGPKIINFLKLGQVFYDIDKRLRCSGKGNLGGTKFLLAQKKEG